MNENDNIHRNANLAWTKRNLSSYRVLLLILSGSICLWLIHPKPLIISDPWRYSEIAAIVSQTGGLHALENIVFHHRLAIILPLALLYRLFGVHAITSHLWSLSAALALIVTVWCMMPRGRSRLTATLLLALSVPLYESSVTIFPDLFVTAFMFASSAMLFCRTKVLEYQKRWIWFPLLAVICLFLAFLSKLSAYWLLPLWAGCFIHDLYQRKYDLLRRFYLPVLFWGVLFGTGYMLFSYEVWGDYLARFSAVELVSNQHLWKLSDKPSSALIQRMTITPVIMLLYRYHIVPLVFLFGLFSLPRMHRFWVWYTFCMLGFYWFGTTSLSHYEPMPLMPRMVLPALPGMCIIGGHFLSSLLAQVAYQPSGGRLLAFLALLLLAFAPLGSYVYHAAPMKKPEREAMQEVQSLVSTHTTSDYVLLTSDRRSARSLGYYFAYQYPDNLVVAYLGEEQAAELVAQHEEILVYVHSRRSRYLAGSYGFKHFDAGIFGQDWTALYEHDGIVLYYPVPPEQVVDVIRDTQEQK